MSLLIYADENVDGRLVAALRRLGWDVVRALDLFPPATDDHVHFAAAAARGRAILTQDQDMLVLAAAWAKSERGFIGVVFITPGSSRTIGEVCRDLTALAAQGRFPAGAVVWL